MLFFAYRRKSEGATRSIQNPALWLWGKVGGNALWDLIRLVVGPSVVIAIVTAAWGLLFSPLGPFIFINCLGAFAITLLIANEIQVRRLRGKVERGELAPPEKVAELESRVGQLTSQLNRERDAAPLRRKIQESLGRFIKRGEEIRDLYRSAPYPPTVDNPDTLHAEWEEQVKTYLHNFIGSSYVSRFIDSPDVVIYGGIASEVVEERKHNYTVIYSQILQLQKFYEEVERDSELDH